MKKYIAGRNELLIKGYKRGKSIEQLAIKYDLGITYVRAILRNAGSIEKRPSISAKERNELLINGYKHGESIGQLAIKYDISQDYIKTILRKASLTARKPSKWAKT